MWKGKAKMKIKRLIGGTYEANGYIVSDSGEAIIIDPGYNPDSFIEIIKKEGYKLKGIYLTHHHYDHVGGVEKIKNEFSCPVFIHRLDGDMYQHPAHYLEHLETFSIGSEEFIVVNTPGHTWGSSCFLNKKANQVFTGDTIFNVDLGRTDLEDGNQNEMEKSITDIISIWSNEMFINPGHGDGCTMKKVRNINNEYNEIMKTAKKNEIKLIALDLDGTTLNKEGKLSQKNKETLKKAVEKGIHVVVATGRCFSAIPDEVKEFDGIEYVVTSNGGLTKELSTGKTVEKNCIDKDAIEGVISALQGNKNMIEVFVDGEAYMEREKYEEIKNGGITYRHRQYVLDTRTPLDNIFQFIRENSEDIENINIFYNDLDERAAAKTGLDRIPEVTITTSLGSNWEIGGKTTSKASALKVLMKKFNISKSEVMACGDNSNDIAMLKLAGIKIAMGNGNPEVKKVAQYIVSTNEFDGVSEAIERFAL